jgi:hypothetical protein
MINRTLFLALIFGGYFVACVAGGVGFTRFTLAAASHYAAQAENDDQSTASDEEADDAELTPQESQAMLNALSGVVGFVILAVVGIVIAGVTECVLLYKAWASIQDGEARTTPGRALAFCFVPLFNLYWIFPAYYGFAVDYNRYLARYHRRSPRLPENLYLAVPTMLVLSWLPYVGMPIAVGRFVVQLILVVKTIDAVNAIGKSYQPLAAGA